MDYQRMHFLLSMRCDAAVHSVEHKLVESGFRVIGRENFRLPSQLGGVHTSRVRYELTVTDIQAAYTTEKLCGLRIRLPKIVIEDSRGAYSEVFLAPAEMGDSGLDGTAQNSFSNETAIRLARVLLDVGRLAFSCGTKETHGPSDDNVTH